MNTATKAQPQKRGRKPTSKFNIDVTKDIIDKAIRNNSAHCVVADAVHKAVPDAQHILVDMQTVRFSLPRTGKRLTYLTPRDVQKYVIAFDAGDELEPFQFTLQSSAVTATRNGQQAKATLTVAPANGQVKRMGGKAPPTGSRTRRDFGIRMLRVNQSGDAGQS